jgi:CRP-like cAMP-binding protein
MLRAPRFLGRYLARDLSISIPWTQMDVADASGISNVHANRIIQELRNLGLVEWDSRRVKEPSLARRDISQSA